jgi:hypothetical protein
MSNESIGVSSICSATNWWLEIRCADSKKLFRRLPIAAWAVSKDNVFSSICYDGDVRKFFCTGVDEDDDGFEYIFKHGINLKQIGNGVPFGDEKPKRILKKGKK